MNAAVKRSASIVGTAAGRRSAHSLVMMRHGQSTWNLENRFTGWVDVPLTDKGRAEATAGGESLKEEGFEFDMVFTSVLTRAVTTCNLALEAAGQSWLPTVKDYRLNERHYGALSGLNKAETSAKHGEDQVKIWRRSFDVPPPSLDRSDEHWPGHDRRYAALSPDVLPLAESLAITCDRVVPFWESDIAPALAAGKRVLIVAHGNSLRALVKHLDGIGNEDIIGVNIPTGVPLVYTLGDDLKPLPCPAGRTAAAPLSGYYLGDQAAIEAEAARVAAQASIRA
ncbi:hypothetical protein FNF27_06887 [Cafeteria roenbergensis]|uniref:Phosphoglycerate mutase n=1 Tax=Cafeteria roenbergensis TaxID=33653 RepID=A0A5A8DW92_CAFRO|nr:hypothetical protein FNF28_07836 [Cafeteria roenbergensis]KAA0146930.1 hypothetical protein FNF29_07734 [Cafeteria roenbergensis]KAA0158252.1 hypothetical protein FNF31_05486 [Cafeteria roenbergensis]KAA0169706.1 hypothetical protein FNF27_06887 [Cafeteria roenbergensis]|eukprot:KAA0146930.1 hypothetical protein FNF29_07734 [Cafeteria roenbergensis]